MKKLLVLAVALLISSAAWAVDKTFTATATFAGQATFSFTLKNVSGDATGAVIPDAPVARSAAPQALGDVAANAAMGQILNAGAQGRGAAGAAGNGAEDSADGNNVIADIPDEGVALSDGASNTKKADDASVTTTIEDDDTAKAAGITQEKQSKLSYLWLLILAASAGVSIEEIKRRKNAKEAAKTSDNETNITE